MNIGNIGSDYYRQTYESTKALFKQKANVSDDDFDKFFTNYQNELYQKKGFSEFQKDNGLSSVRQYVFDITPEELFESNNLMGNYTFTESNERGLSENAVSLSPGMVIDLGNGYQLKIEKDKVIPECKNPALYNQNEWDKASKLAGALNIFIRYANGQIGNLYLDKTREGEVREVLAKIGIDMNKIFNVNGATFSADNSGITKEGDIKGYSMITDAMMKRAIERTIEKYTQMTIYL